MLKLSRSYVIYIFIAVISSLFTYYVVCHMFKVDGGFTQWSKWTECSSSCGEGVQKRNRNCTNPKPNFLGRHCLADGSHNVEIKKCNVRLCPIDGQFTAWSAFGQCSKTCSGGVQKRTRACQNPAPQNGGKDCEGSSDETKDCNSEILCPIHGGFSNWSEFSKCSVTCGVGTQLRTRTCTKPTPKAGGKFCEGVLEEKQACEVLCPTNKPARNFSVSVTNASKLP